MATRTKRSRWTAAILLTACLLSLLTGPACAAADGGAETVRVGWFEDSYNITGAHGERSGYGYEYQQSVAAYTGWTYEYVKAGWSDLLKQVESGEIDLLSGVSYTAERAETLLFSDRPMGEEKYYLYADMAHTDISPSDLKTLNGKRVAMLEGSVQATLFFQWEEKHGLHLEPVYVESTEAAIEKAQNGEVDCLISAETPQRVADGMSGIVVVGASDIYFVVNRDRPELKEALDVAMREIARNKPFYADELHQKYLSAASTAVLTREEQAWLAQHGAIRVGWVNHDTGISVWDKKSGTVKGVLTDYLRLAANCLDNQELRFETVRFESQAEELQALKNGDIDMIFHFSQVPYAAEDNGLVLSNTVLSPRHVAVTAQNFFDEGAAHTVAVQADDQMLKWSLSYQYPNWTVVEYDSTARAEQAVRSGRTDCLIASAERLTHYIEDSKLYSVYLTQPDDAAFAVRRGDTVLLSVLNKTLRTMPSSELTGALSMYNNSARQVTVQDFIKGHLTMVTMVMLAVLLVVLAALRRFVRAENRTRQLNEELQGSQRQLQEALARAESANSAKTVFLSNMSHDIRTPMNAIVGITDLMAHEPGNSDKMHSYIEKVQMSSRHLLSLINDILDMSKIESNEVALNQDAIRLADQVDQVDNIIRPQAAERGQTFTIRAHTIAHEYLVGDGVRLRQVFLNLLSNAVKYTPCGGEVRLDLAELPCGEPDHAAIQIRVEDNGCGMTPEFAARVFQPFTRAESSLTNKVQGTGLGMAITKNIVDLMGGTITVESEVDKGSCFTVNLTLPIDRSVEHTCEADHVLLISEEKVLIENVRAAMGETEISLHVAGSVAEAGAFLARNPVDVILLSGGLHDPELAADIRRLRQSAQNTMHIFCCDYAQQDQVRDILAQSGADGLVARPFFLSNLSRAMEHTLSRTTVQDEQSHSVLSGMRFLCAEDNELNAEILKAILDMNGADCVIYPDGKQLLDAFAAVQPGDYDAILLDVQMPVMNGLEATRAIRRCANPLGRTIPILAMTANAFTEDIQACIDAGMNAHVSKPLDIAVLERTLRGILSGKNAGGGHLFVTRRHDGINNG